MRLSKPHPGDIKTSVLLRCAKGYPVLQALTRHYFFLLHFKMGYSQAQKKQQQKKKKNSANTYFLLMDSVIYFGVFSAAEEET